MAEAESREWSYYSPPKGSVFSLRVNYLGTLITSLHSQWLEKCRHTRGTVTKRLWLFICCVDAFVFSKTLPTSLSEVIDQIAKDE